MAAVDFVTCYVQVRVTTAVHKAGCIKLAAQSHVQATYLAPANSPSTQPPTSDSTRPWQKITSEHLPESGVVQKKTAKYHAS
jgi:hypothetical protein